MTTSLFNYGPLPNADMVAKVIEHARAINQVQFDAVESPTSKANDPSKTASAPDSVDAIQSTDKTTTAKSAATDAPAGKKGVLA